jgi:SAM-dependent methyltransferase
MNDFTKLYDSNYFKNRNFNDLKRRRSFEQERELLKKYVDFNGSICDVGCSTGEFLQTIGWNGAKYGLDVNEEAIKVAQASGVSFDKNILNSKNNFDIVVFRGTIQHLPDPFGYIEKSHNALKPGGYIAFLATPNANSITYKLFNTLPALSPKFNFFIPSDVTLGNILNNYGFELLEIEYPYLTSPYASPLHDHLKFIKCLLTREKPNFAFWKSMMNIVATKK